MSKENLILSKDFFDFEVFALPEEESSDYATVQNPSLNTLVSFAEQEKQPVLIDLLHNILKAAQLDLAQQVHTLAITKATPYSFIRLQTKARFERAILFGVDPGQLGIQLDLQPYQPFPFQGCVFLLADRLTDIAADKEKKKQLWNSLQAVYLS